MIEHEKLLTLSVDKSKNELLEGPGLDEVNSESLLGDNLSLAPPSTPSLLPLPLKLNT